MTDATPTRRRVLQLTGSAAVIGLAGCSGSGAQDRADGGGDDHATEDSHQDEDEHAEDEDDHAGEEDNHAEEDENGHDHDEGTPESPAESAAVVLRTEGSEQHFSPHVVWVEPGGTVTWELESGSHDVVAYHPDNDRPRRMPADAEPWQSDLLTEAGATVEHTFEVAGVYDYFCTPHESMGMVGTVIVGEPDAHDQPGLAEPQESLPEGARTQLHDLGESANEALGHTH